MDQRSIKEQIERISKQINADFSFIKKETKIQGIFLYGSYLKGYNTKTSDIDVCFVAPNQNLYEIYQFLTHNLKNNNNLYDIHFFEELPLYIQGEILDNGYLVYSRDAPALYEYLYFKSRRDWEDLKFRLKYSI